MEWSRIKTIILLILAVTNALLLGFLTRWELQHQSAQAEALQNAVAFLRENGVSVEDGLVPEEMDLRAQTVAWDRERERAAAGVLLGGEVREQAWSDEIYRYYTEAGSLQFHRDGTFQGEFLTGAFPVAQEALEARCLEVLRILDFEGEPVSSFQTADGGETVLAFRQLWDGVPVFNHQAALTIRAGSLVRLEGRRLTGAPREDASRSPISVPTALFRFYHGVVSLGDACSRIDRITPGYVTAAGTGPASMTPVWQIATDTRTYRLDLISGTLSRVET